MISNKPILICDTECYSNYWLVKFYNPESPGISTCSIELFEGGQLNKNQLYTILCAHKIVTFNGIYYDFPMIAYVMAGATCAQLKAASDLIITKDLKWWEFYRQFEIDQLEYVDHIDIREVLRGVGVGLKLYGGRLNCKNLQELPIAPDTILTPLQMAQISQYCTNDLITTYEAFKCCAKELSIREHLSEEYKIDLRSKSDAQIAEALIKKLLGFKPSIPFWKHGTSFKYKAPAFINFDNNPHLFELLNLIESSNFYTADEDQVSCDEDGNAVTTGIAIPKEIKDFDIKIGQSSYTFGKGGLHSNEKHVNYVATKDCHIIDADVVSYYPSLILLCGIFPKQLGDRFLTIYREIYNARRSAKATGDKIKSECFKIILNGTFGKLGSKYSIFFSPDLLLMVTITGQLALLMLIDALERKNIHVISANTDGIVMLCPPNLEQVRQEVFKEWECKTGLQMEHTYYKSIYMQNVNNYVAFKTCGEIKTKGIFSDLSVGKSPKNHICVRAAIEFLHKRVPVEETIYNCTTLLEFLTVRKVAEGAVFIEHKELPDHTFKEELVDFVGFVQHIVDNKVRWLCPKTNKLFTVGEAYKLACAELQKGYISPPVGKVVRFYYKKGQLGHLARATNHNRVDKSDGANLVMQLPETFPNDIDYDKYVTISKKMLTSVSVNI